MTMYKKMLPLWQYVDDCYTGVPAIKADAKRQKYLMPSPSEKDDIGKGGQYDMRCHLADYDNIFRSAIASMVGIMGKNPATVRFDQGDEEVTPQEVRDIDVWGNKYDDRLAGLKARLNHAQTLFGRAGLLLEVKTGKSKLDPKFVILEYDARSILDGETFQSPIDGKTRLKWVKLDESHDRFNEQTKVREWVTRYRILGLDGQGWYYSAVLEGADADSQWRNFDLNNPAGAAYPHFKTSRLPFVPFTVCNVDRLGIDEWQAPPFIDMAYSTINAYNADSIYKQALANHAKPTLVIANAQTQGKIVLGGMLKLASSAGVQADAKILETGGAGLSALGQSVDRIKNDALRRTIQGMLESAGANSSGEALMLRTAAGTATIASIDLAGARAIEEQLCFAARWAGATEREAGEWISYTVDTSYMGDTATLQEVVSLLTANSAGGRKLLSRQNLYAVLKKEFGDTISDYEDNELQVEEEEFSGGSFADALNEMEDADALELPDDAVGTEEAAQTAVIQSVALNGAQVTAAVEIVMKVSAGELPKDTAIQMLMDFFGLSREQVIKMVEPALKFADEKAKKQSENSSDAKTKDEQEK